MSELKLADVVEDLTFIPHPDQRKVKAALWAVINDNPAFDIDSITAEDVVKITADSRVRRWWKETDFRSWLLNKDEFRQRLEYQAQLALDTLERVLISTDAKSANAQVQAAKLILEAASKMPQKWTKEVWADERISKMDKLQLQEYIKKNSHLLAAVASAANKEEEVE